MTQQGTFRRKPIEVQAIPASEAVYFAATDWAGLPDWLRKAYETHAATGWVLFAADHVIIRTAKGVMRAYGRDWIIRGVQGELYPCKNEIFLATYERVVSE